jgi:hypothetical protein
MPLSDTNLLIQMAPLPATFKNTPQQLAAEMVRRMKIVSPSGTNFIFIGDTEPASNVGPWLRDGTKWWVFDDGIKRYVPLDISDSLTLPFFMGASIPATSDPPVWLKTSHDPTSTDSSFGNPISWYVWNGSQWIPYVGIVLSGPTASRPVGPVDYQQYYDTDIACLIWFERSQWRTISGVPGDIKFVSFEILTDALTANPGWILFGAANQNFRGRYISQATMDAGPSPATDLTTTAGVAHRAAFTTYGETDGVQLNGASPVPYPPTIALFCLVKT